MMKAVSESDSPNLFTILLLTMSYLKKRENNENKNGFLRFDNKTKSTTVKSCNVQWTPRKRLLSVRYLSSFLGVRHTLQLQLFLFSFCAGINNFKKWVTKFYFTFCNPLWTDWTKITQVYIEFQNRNLTLNGIKYVL